MGVWANFINLMVFWAIIFIHQFYDRNVFILRDDIIARLVMCADLNLFILHYLGASRLEPL